jgi:hypothetical protein
MSGRPGPLGRAQSARRPRRTPGRPRWGLAHTANWPWAVAMPASRSGTGRQRAERGASNTVLGGWGGSLTG